MAKNMKPRMTRIFADYSLPVWLVGCLLIGCASAPEMPSAADGSLPSPVF